MPITFVLTVPFALPAHPRTHDEHDLDKYELRPGVDGYILNLVGSYGQPVVHAANGNCGIARRGQCPPIRNDVAEQLWRNECLLRPLGASVVQFCANCASRHA